MPCVRPSNNNQKLGGFLFGKVKKNEKRVCMRSRTRIKKCVEQVCRGGGGKRPIIGGKETY